MELIETTEGIAKIVLDSKKRIIRAVKGGRIFRVRWINDNNHTCGISAKARHESMANNEDVVFYIQVPANAKTIY